MERSGGGFASALAKCFYVADGHNQRTLVSAFEYLFEKYYEYSVEHERRIEAGNRVREQARAQPEPITSGDWALTLAGRPVCVGTVLNDFRGDAHIITGGTPPHKPGSTGRIETDQGSFFPSVCGLAWLHPEQPKD